MCHLLVASFAHIEKIIGQRSAKQVLIKSKARHVLVFFFFYSLAFFSSPVAVKGTRCIEPGEHSYFNSLFEPLPNALQYLLCLWLVFGGSG